MQHFSDRLLQRGKTFPLSRSRGSILISSYPDIPVRRSLDGREGWILVHSLAIRPIGTDQNTVILPHTKKVEALELGSKMMWVERFQEQFVPVQQLCHAIDEKKGIIHPCSCPNSRRTPLLIKLSVSTQCWWGGDGMPCSM